MALLARFRTRAETARVEPTLAPLPGHRRARRAFGAAEITRLTAGWKTTIRSANASLRTALRKLRARARDLAENDGHIRHFLSLVADNVVGPHGIRLQMRVKTRAGETDEGANAAIEDAWQTWGRVRSCTVDRRLSWVDAQRQAITSIARDGEVLVRLIRGRSAGNREQFALQLLEADYLDDDLVRRVREGREIYMGVEVDGFGGPVAYHLLTDHPGDDVGRTQASRRHERIPADQLLHLFVPHRVGAFRGVPWLYAAMTRSNMLGGYEEAELVAARVSAAKMGVVVSPDGDPNRLQDDEENGTPVIDVEAGTIGSLPAGYDLKMFDPNHPNGAFGEFMKSVLRGIASGLDVSYHSLANDLEGVNYSSIRQGALEDRDHWRGLQCWLIEHLHGFVFEAWLESALTFGALPYSLTELERLNAPSWQPRGWHWVDPLKEVASAKEAVALGIKSRTEIAAEQGRDFADTLHELKREQDLARDLGVNLNGGPDAGRQPGAPGAGPEPDDQPDDDEDDPDA